MCTRRSVLYLSCVVLLTGLMVGPVFAIASVTTSRSGEKGGFVADDVPAAELYYNINPITYPSIAIKEKGVQLNISEGSPLTPQPGGGWAVDSFFDITYRVDLDTPSGPVTVTGPGTGHVVGTGALYDLNEDGVINQADQGARLFDTEMLSLDLDGGPFFKIRESPTKQSLGLTLIENEPAGTFRIGSFFDVFTELSVDGGQTWQPASDALTVVSSVPEPTSFVLAALAVGGAATLGRRRTK